MSEYEQTARGTTVRLKLGAQPPAQPASKAKATAKAAGQPLPHADRELLSNLGVDEAQFREVVELVPGVAH